MRYENVYSVFEKIKKFQFSFLKNHKKMWCFLAILAKQTTNQLKLRI